MVLALDLNAFFRLQSLVEPLGISPPFHRPAGELVDDHHTAVFDDVIGVALEQTVRAQGGVDMVDQRDVLQIVQRAAFNQANLGQQRLDMLGAGISESGGLLLFVDLVILRHQFRDQGVDLAIKGRAVLGRAGDNQRRARLVDEDRVDLVDDGEVELALDHVIQAELHIVAQVIEAEFVVGAISDIGGVLSAPRVIVETVDDAAGGQAQLFINLPHPAGVTAGQIIVHCDDMHTGPVESIEINRQGRHQGLALTGFHLRDPAHVQDHAADQLDVEMALTEGAFGGLANRRESFLQKIVEGRPGGETVAEFRGLGSQRGVVQSLHFRLEGVDRGDPRRQPFEDPVILRPKQGLGQISKHDTSRVKSRPPPHPLPPADR